MATQHKIFHSILVFDILRQAEQTVASCPCDEGCHKCALSLSITILNWLMTNYRYCEWIVQGWQSGIVQTRCPRGFAKHFGPQNWSQQCSGAVGRKRRLLDNHRAALCATIRRDSGESRKGMKFNGYIYVIKAFITLIPVMTSSQWIEIPPVIISLFVSVPRRL